VINDYFNFLQISKENHVLPKQRRFFNNIYSILPPYRTIDMFLHSKTMKEENSIFLVIKIETYQLTIIYSLIKIQILVQTLKILKSKFDVLKYYK